MSENKARKVKEIFSDYQARANIIEAEISKLRCNKKDKYTWNHNKIMMNI